MLRPEAPNLPYSDDDKANLIVGTDAGWKLIHTNGWEP